jgi:hypothetical protein
MDFNKILTTFAAITSNKPLNEAAEKSDKPWTDKSGKKHPGTAVKGDKYSGKEAEKEEKAKPVKESTLAELIAKMDAIIESTEKVDEEDVEEGNEFSGELAKAKAAGKDDFEVAGKKYKVQESEKTDKPWTDMSGKKQPGTAVKGDKYKGDEADKEEKAKKVDEAAEKTDKPWTDMSGKKQPGTAVKGDKYKGDEADKEEKAKKVDEAKLAECGDMMGGMMGGEPESNMSVNTSVDTRTGHKTVSISADGDKADQLMQMLKLAGLGGMGSSSGDVDGDGDHDIADHAQEMGAEVVSIPLAHANGGYQGPTEEVEEEYSNEPNPQTQGIDTQMRQGTDLNREKTMHKHSYRQGDNPMAMREAKELAFLEAEIAEGLDSIKVKKPSASYKNTFKKPTLVKKVK